ncbi:carboxypeptidase regulatory-like domain-containing protein [Candidatus Dojkabacteria bacterium]|nr:carboxypeptidase regulatory-like domain-containing protein [Candidatus Dojkabacteria bacterium]
MKYKKFTKNLSICLLTLALAILLFSFFSITPTKAQGYTTNGQFYFSNIPESMKIGCKSSISLIVDPGSNSSNAANIIIHYDPQKIDIEDSITTIPGTQVKQGDAYEAYAQNSVDENTGEILITGFSLIGELNSARTFAIIEFYPKQGVQNATFEIQFDGVRKTTDSNIAETYTSDDILGSVSNITLEFSQGNCIDDTIPPVITPTSPKDRDSNILPDSSFSFEVCDNKFSDTGVDINTVTVIINGTPYTIADGPYFSYTGNPECYTITVNPIEIIPEDNSTTINYLASDFKGNHSQISLIINIPEDQETQEEIGQIEQLLLECQQQVCLPETGENFGPSLQSEIQQTMKTIETNESVKTVIQAVPTMLMTTTVLASTGIGVLEIPALIIQMINFLKNLLKIGLESNRPGQVYDSRNRNPISRAVIRVFSENRIVQTTVTDNEGYFSLNLKKGIYTITVYKRGYVFPSQFVSNITPDKKKPYQGEPIEITNEAEIVELSIPLDPKALTKTERLARQKLTEIGMFIKNINYLLVILSTTISIYLFISTHNPANLIWVAINLVLTIISAIASRRKVSDFGVITDQFNIPVPGIQIGLFEPNYERLIDFKFTDESGKYYFLVPSGEYQLKSLSKEYEILSDQKPNTLKIQRSYKAQQRINIDIIVKHTENKSLKQ